LTDRVAEVVDTRLVCGADLLLAECLQACVNLAFQFRHFPLVDTLVVTARIGIEVLEDKRACRVHDRSKIGDDRGLSYPRVLCLLVLEWCDLLVENYENLPCDLVAPELRKKLLLCWKIEVLVVYNLVPDALCVCGETVCGDSAMVLRKEDRQLGFIEKAALLRVVVSFPEAQAQFVDSLLELLWLQDLVGKCDEGEIEVVLDARVLEAGRFRYVRPQLR
jgi:hypothetical protein